MSLLPKQRRYSRIAPTQSETSSFISLTGETVRGDDDDDDDDNDDKNPAFDEEGKLFRPPGVSHSSSELRVEGNLAGGADQPMEYSQLNSIVSPTLGVSDPSKLGQSAFASPSESTVSVSSPSISTTSRVNLVSEYTQDEQLRDKLAHSSYIPPWTAPYIIGIAGNSGSGKTSISQQIIQGINQPWTVLLSFDNFYKSLSPEESRRAFANEYDFDTPLLLDLDAVVETVRTLKRGGKSTIPVYSFAKHARIDKTNTIYGANVIIVEGLYALYDPRLLAMMDLKIMRPTNQLRGINAILFNKNTSRDDFIFYFNRLSGLLIEHAQLNFYDYKPKEVICFEKPYKYQGLRAQQSQMVAVSIIRSGDCFMTSLKKTFPELTVGKMLIQSDSSTGEPQLHYESLPHNISSIGKILLLDSQTISGAGAIMAIQVLVDHKVKQENIIFVSYLSTEIGVRRILNVFPKVQLVIGKLSSMDATQFGEAESGNKGNALWYNEESFLDSHWHFRNRFIDSLYFGTD